MQGEVISTHIPSILIGPWYSLPTNLYVLRPCQSNKYGILCGKLSRELMTHYMLWLVKGMAHVPQKVKLRGKS